MIPIIDVVKFDQLKEILASMARAVEAAAKAAPSHDGYFAGYKEQSGAATQ